jgi:hypothetical protein
MMSENQQVVVPPPPQVPHTSGKAVVSLVFGILAFVLFPISLVCTVVALATGYPAKKEIDGSNGYLTGRGMAQAGIILGWVSVGLVVVPVCIITILALLGPAIGSVFSGITESI